MKTKQLLLSFMAVAIIGGTAIFLLNDANDGTSIGKKYQVRENINSNDNQYGAAGAAEWIGKRRVNPATGTISSKDIAAARRSFEESELNRDADDGVMNWEFIGPDDVGGRTRAFLIDNRDNRTLWAGGVAGGIWKSTTDGASWLPVDIDAMDNIAVSSMCQDSEGNIYVGTGESFIGGTGTALYTPGFQGSGIWKSTDGFTFEQIASTSNSTDFEFVNELIFDAGTNAIYSATNDKLLKSTNGGETWETLYDAEFPERGVSDVKIAEGNTVVFSVNSNVTSTIFVKRTGETAVSKYSELNQDGSFDRIELAVSPSNPNYVYALCSYSGWEQGKYFNLYQSQDAGDTWQSLLQQHTPSIDPFGTNRQGGYDNIISVFPDNPEKVVLGGINLWTWSEADAFEQISYSQEFAGYKYVHADQHSIVFHPDYADNQTIYFANDGGVFVSYNDGLSFTAINKNYGITQFYAIDCGPNGEILGGTQDNGTPYIDLSQNNNPESSVEVTGGDGGYTAVSELYPEAIFSTVYYCQLRRSNENGAAATMQFDPFDATTSDNLSPGNERNPFITPIDLWESFDYDSSRVYIPYVIDTVLEIGSGGIPDTIVQFGEGYTFFVPSSTVDNKTFEYEITADDIARNNGDSLSVGDTIPVREKFASLLAIGGAGDNDFSGKLYITRSGLDFKDAYPNWDAIVSKIPGQEINDHLDLEKVNYVKWAPDGNSLYAIAVNGSGQNGLYRFTGIQEAYNFVSDLGAQQAVPTYDNRIITIVDTVLNTARHSFFECDSTYQNDVSLSDVSNISNYTTDYTTYSFNVSSEPYPNVLNIDSFYTPRSYNLNLISLQNSTLDTIFNFNTDSIASMNSSNYNVEVNFISTTNMNYSDVIRTDTVSIGDPDTIVNFIQKIIIDGVFGLDTIFNVNTDSIVNTSLYNSIVLSENITSNTSMLYDSIVKIDTVLVLNDTLINATYKDLSEDCDIEALNGVNIDTISAFQMINQSVDYYDITMNSTAVYDSIVRIDTIINIDTTYQMGVMGPDMVWNTREVNTISQIQGALVKNFATKVPTSISIDPKNVENLMVTVGGYGAHAKVYYTTNATTATSSDLVVIDGAGLPEAPIYSSLISDTVPQGETDLLIVGTEFGVYSTNVANGASTVWIREAAMPKVPVFSLVQQRHANGYVKGVGHTGVTNSGVIYAGTHGLGAWKMDKYARIDIGIEEIQAEKVDALTVKVYPNPVKNVANVEYHVAKASNVEIEVYSLTGKMVYRQTIANQYKGTHVHKISAETLNEGVYVISVTSNEERKVSKFIVE